VMYNKYHIYDIKITSSVWQKWCWNSEWLG
jgi:hypothetical protein